MTQENDFSGIRAKREVLKLTLKDVFALTRISEINLEAIENGDFHNLPAPIYTKNFIKTYARVLDLDSKPILDSYQNYLNSQQIVQPPILDTVPEKEQKLFLGKIPSYKIILTITAVGIIAVLATVIISQQNQTVSAVRVATPAIVAPMAPVVVKATENQHTSPLLAPPTTQPQTAASLLAVPSTKKEPHPASLLQPVPPAKQNIPAGEKNEQETISKGTDVLVIKATEETWLKITSDQNQVFRYLLQPGEQIVSKGAYFEVDIGNAGGVTMTFNGKLIENLGKSGQVIHMQFP